MFETMSPESMLCATASRRAGDRGVGVADGDLMLCQSGQCLREHGVAGSGTCEGDAFGERLVRSIRVEVTVGEDESFGVVRERQACRLTEMKGVFE